MVHALEQWFPNCGTRTASGTRRPSRWYARPFCSSTQKKTICFSLSRFVNKFLHFSVLPLLVSKNGHYNFSQPFCSCRICVKSGLPNFLIEWYWVEWVFLEQCVFKVVHRENRAHKWYAIRKKLGNRCARAKWYSFRLKLSFAQLKGEGNFLCSKVFWRFSNILCQSFHSWCSTEK